MSMILSTCPKCGGARVDGVVGTSAFPAHVCPEDLGKMLQNNRTQRGMTRKELAGKAGLTERQIRQMEHGKDQDRKLVALHRIGTETLKRCPDCNGRGTQRIGKSVPGRVDCDRCGATGAVEYSHEDNLKTHEALMDKGAIEMPGHPELTCYLRDDGNPADNGVYKNGRRVSEKGPPGGPLRKEVT